MNVRRGWMVAVAIVAGSLLVVSAGRPAAAQTIDIEPIAGQWCGMTDDGGSIRLEVTADRNFVRNVDIRTFKGSVSVAEGVTQPGAQIKSSQFILRATGDVIECERRVQPPQPGNPGGPSRCERAPCRPNQPRPGSGEVCRRVTVDTQLIRGHFRAVDSLTGTFTFLADSKHRVYGEYTAWPASLAPCP